MAVAVAMITARLRLHARDTVQIRRARDAPDQTKGELPEVNRSTHYS
jgi:hypothetical protein